MRLRFFHHGGTVVWKALLQDSTPCLRAAFFFLLTGLLHPLSAQPYNFVSFSLADGLPQSQVFAMCQDSRGYLWLGTQGGGLTRFDGQQFEIFTAANGLPSNYIGALAEDARHRLWIGTSRGLYRYDGKLFEPIQLAGNSSGAAINALAIVPGNTIWIGTDRGLFSCSADAAAAQPVTLPGKGPIPVILAILPTENGVWVGTTRGAWRFGKQNLQLSEREGLPGSAVFGFTLDTQKRLWMASLGGIALWDENSGRIISSVRDAAISRPFCLDADTDGHVWIGTTNNGLVQYNPGDSSLTVLTEKDGLPHQHVRCLLRDRGGQLWIGTSGGGLARLSRQPFRHYDQSRGLAGNRVYALHEDRQERLWLGVSAIGVQLLDSSGFESFTRDSGFLRIKCKTIAEDIQGNIWIGTEGRGIAVFDSAGMHRLDRQRGLPSDLIQKIVRGPAGEMWAATLSGGIVRITRTAAGDFSVKTFGLREGLPDLQIQTLLSGTNGSIWFGTQAGNIGFIQKEKITVFGNTSGLPGVTVRALATDAAGRIWAGTKGAGIFWMDPAAKSPRFQAAHPKSGQYAPNIYLLKFDASGNLWSGSETGVDKLVFSEKGSTVTEVQHFGKNEGFLGIETCQDAVLEDRRGQLWFGTMNGLVRYTPTAWQNRVTTPLVHFETISLLYKPLSDSAFSALMNAPGSLELPHHLNHLSFAFQGIDVNNPQSIRYRWRFGSSQTDWSPLTTQREVSYASLAPGQYTFEVQATTDGETFSAPVAVSFVIKEPFWRLWWFSLLVGITLSGLLAMLALAWVQRIRKAEQTRREKLEVQNRLLQLEQKALQLQMNPHFIFNALTSISALITEHDYPKARQEISRFAQLMRGILANSRRQTISLQEEVNTLTQYLRIEQFCQGQKFDFQIELPEYIDPEEVELPPMLLQPFVENAVVHGVAPLPYPGHISIRFILQGEILTCEIQDNGIGRERAARLREEKKPGHQSAALQVTQERLEALRGDKNYVPLEIGDLLDEKGGIAGTRVTVRLWVEGTFGG